MKLGRRLFRTAEGSVSVEMALVITFFVTPLLLGTVDVGQIMQGRAKTDEALQDAIAYVSAGNSSNTSGITTAAQAAYGTGITVATSTACYCVSETTTTPTAPTTVSCSGTCSSGSVLMQFLSITVSNSVNVLFPISYFNLTSPKTVSATGLVRTG